MFNHDRNSQLQKLGAKQIELFAQLGVCLHQPTDENQAENQLPFFQDTLEFLRRLIETQSLLVRSEASTENHLKSLLADQVRNSIELAEALGIDLGLAITQSDNG